MEASAVRQVLIRTASPVDGIAIKRAIAVGARLSLYTVHAIGDIARGLEKPTFPPKLPPGEEDRAFIDAMRFSVMLGAMPESWA